MLTLLRNARVLSPAPLGVRDVLVTGGRIAAVAEHLPDPPAGWPAEVIDLEGRWLAPGLVDVHTHLAGGGGEGGAHTRVPPLGLTALTTAGVTTAIGLLGTDCTTRNLADLLAVARGLSHYGPTCLCYTGGYEVPPPTLTGSVRGDIVHVDRIVAVGEVAISDHRSSQPTYDELVRLAADAHVAGLMTGKAGLLHLHLGDGARGLSMVRRALAETELPARVFHPTHVNRNQRLWQEAVALLDAGGWIDLTADSEGDLGPSAAGCLAELHAGGKPLERVTLSSDGGGCLPTFDADGVLLKMGVGSSSTLLTTVRAATEHGVPLSEAIATCTANAARLFRLHGKGIVAPGADADLVVLDENLTVEATMASGRLLVRNRAPVVTGAFETTRSPIAGGAAHR